jgi:hypothetical protein
MRLGFASNFGLLSLTTFSNTSLGLTLGTSNYPQIRDISEQEMRVYELSQNFTNSNLMCSIEGDGTGLFGSLLAAKPGNGRNDGSKSHGDFADPAGEIGR